MDMKKNKGLIVLLVVAVLWEMFTIGSIKTQNKNLERQISHMSDYMYSEMSGIRSSVYNIKVEITEELEKQSSFLSDYKTDISFKEGVLFLDLSFTPKEYKSGDGVEVVFASTKESKVFPAVNEDGTFKVRGELLPSDSFETTVRFISDSGIRQETLPKIEAAEDLAFEYNARLLSEIEFYEEIGKPIEKPKEDGSDTMVVSIFPFYSSGRVDAPYKDIDSAKFILTNRATSKKIGEYNLEEDTNDKFYEDLKAIEGSTVLIGKLPEIKSIEGSFRIDCELRTKDGLFYKFEMGRIDNYINVNSKEFESQYHSGNSGIAYPEF